MEEFHIIVTMCDAGEMDNVTSHMHIYRKAQIHVPDLATIGRTSRPRNTLEDCSV